MSKTNPLLDSKKPLFFPLANTEHVGITAPKPRLGLAVRTIVRSLSVMQKEALVINSNTSKAWRLASDEGAYLNGQDSAPCPLSFLTTGMVCSYMNETLALAKQRNINIGSIKLIQDNFYTMQGSALKGTMRGGAKDIQLEAVIESDASKADLQALVLDAVAASPLNGLMQAPIESLFSVTHNGQDIENGKTLPINTQTPSDPNSMFDQAGVGTGEWTSHIIRGGLTPKTEESVTLAGDSLSEHQDRTLHVRGICTIRKDGIKQVEQQLFNPHGSIFTFLCEEGADNGGQGRAPDAASYIAAGIGFCFMTQLGRYAKITKKDLSGYRIVQDAHFSLGGATGNTGKPGTADPLETHVYLETGEEDDYARTLVDMSEQTCFLHAFCKAELKAKIKITTTSNA